MRNKTEEFKRKFTPGNRADIQNSPLKTTNKTFCRSSCNLQVPQVQFFDKPLKTERLLANKLSDLTMGKMSETALGKRGSRRVPKHERRGFAKREISIVGSLTDMGEGTVTTLTTVSEVKWGESGKEKTVNAKEFIDGLGKNELFYCCGCFQYVFEIEKGRHFPECRDQLDFPNIPKDKVLEVCWGRLEKVV